MHPRDGPAFIQRPRTAAAACRRASQAETRDSHTHLCGLDAPKIQVGSKLRLECINRRRLLQCALCGGLRWQRQQGRRGALPQRGLREYGHLQRLKNRQGRLALAWLEQAEGDTSTAGIHVPLCMLLTAQRHTWLHSRPQSSRSSVALAAGSRWSSS